MGKVAGGSSGRRARAALVGWLVYMVAAVAAPAFGQQSAAQLDDLTRTVTQYTPPKANAPARASTAPNAPAHRQDKHVRQAVATSVRGKSVQSVPKPATAGPTPALSLRDALVPTPVPGAAARSAPVPSKTKIATTPHPPSALTQKVATTPHPQTPPALPVKAPAIESSAASLVTPPLLPASNASGPARTAGQHGEARTWTRPWAWVAAALVVALLLVEVAGWRRHHRRKRDAAVLANIVPTVRPGDREADYHPKPAQSSDHSRQFGAG